MQLAYLLKMTVSEGIFFVFSKHHKILSLQIYELNPTGSTVTILTLPVSYIH